MKANIYDIWNCDLSGHGDGDELKTVPGLWGADKQSCDNLKFCRHYWSPGTGTATGFILTGVRYCRKGLGLMSKFDDHTGETLVEPPES